MAGGLAGCYLWTQLSFILGNQLTVSPRVTVTNMLTRESDDHPLSRITVLKVDSEREALGRLPGALSRVLP